MEKSLFLCPWEPESKSTSQNMCFGQPSLTTYFNSLVDGSPKETVIPALLPYILKWLILKVSLMNLYGN